MRQAPVVIILLLLGLFSVGAQDTELEFSFRIEDYKSLEIINSLRKGHRSEVLYEFRLLREATGIAKIFGDRLIKETQVLYVARWDALDKNYIVLIDNTTERAFDDPDMFLDFFLSVKNRTMSLAGALQDGDYLLCRSRLQPIKLVPPLTLMTLIKPDLQIISSWRRTDFARVTR